MPAGERDPTQNVIALIEAAVIRLDDLQSAQKALEVAEHQHLRDLFEMRGEYEDRIWQAESSRVNAIRAVDYSENQTAHETVQMQLRELRLDIAELRQAQYQAQGSAIEVEDHRSASGLMIAAVGLGVSTLITLIALIGFVLTNTQ